MIVTDGFVFLHLHKSGGSFVNEFLKRFFPSAREIGYHLPWSLVPASHAHLPALGLVPTVTDTAVNALVYSAHMIA